MSNATSAMEMSSNDGKGAVNTPKATTLQGQTYAQAVSTQRTPKSDKGGGTTVRNVTQKHGKCSVRRLNRLIVQLRPPWPIRTNGNGGPMQRIGWSPYNSWCNFSLRTWKSSSLRKRSLSPTNGTRPGAVGLRKASTMHLDDIGKLQWRNDNVWQAKHHTIYDYHYG